MSNHIYKKNKYFLTATLVKWRGLNNKKVKVKRTILKKYSTHQSHNIRYTHLEFYLKKKNKQKKTFTEILLEPILHSSQYKNFLNEKSKIPLFAF